MIGKPRRRQTDVQPRRRRWTRRVLRFLGAAASLWLGLQGIFAFRGITYLSDSTFLISVFPLGAVLVGLVLLAVNAALLRRRRTRTRWVLTGVSALSALSIMVNAAVFASGAHKDEMPETTSENEAIAATVARYGDQLTAGAAKADITPASTLMPMPLLAVLKFNRVADRVHTRVLALSDGQQETLFITLDMTLVPRADKTLSLLSEKTGIPRKNIFVAATHTHGTTPISLYEPIDPVGRMKVDAWYEQIQKTLVTTAQEARSKLAPARYGYGTGTSNVNVNRDVVVDGGKAVLGSNFDRPSDKTVKIARFDTLDGHPIALIVNYAVHGVVLNGLLNGTRTPLSGDLPGLTSTRLEERLPGAVALWTSGAAGDQNPRITTQFAPAGQRTSGYLGNAGLLVLGSLADEHARDILRANASIKATARTARLFAAESRVDVPSREKAGTTVPYTLRQFMVGDLTFLGISAEIVTSIGKQIVGASPRPNTVLVTLANGYQGYVADDWHYEHDAFEHGPTVKGEAQKSFLKTFADMEETAPTTAWLTRK